MYSYNNNIEQAYLWSIIFDNDILSNTNLKEDDFEVYKNQLIFKMFNAIRNAWKDITPLIFKSFIESKWLVEKIWYGYFAEIEQECEHSEFWKTYEGIIKKNSIKNKVKQIKWWITENNIYDSMKQLSSLSVSDEKWTKVYDLVNSVWNLLDEFKKRWQMLWDKWPFSLLDKYYGGIIAWKVYTICAYSNVWKTSFSYPYVVNALKQWKRVRVFSTEEQKDKVFLNIIKSYYNKSIWEYMNDFNIDMEDFKNLTIYDNLFKLEDILKETKKEDVIFIDFIQNLKTKWEWEYEKMTNIAQELQRKAIQDNNIIFSISQVNNDSRNKTAWYMQPKWSWAIFASSDVILALYKENDMLKLNLLKNKFWPNNIKYLVNADFKRLQFKLAEEEETNLSTDFNN